MNIRNLDVVFLFTLLKDSYAEIYSDFLDSYHVQPSTVSEGFVPLTRRNCSRVKPKKKSEKKSGCHEKVRAQKKGVSSSEISIDKAS